MASSARSNALRNLRFVLRYDGTEFQGWQTQPGYRTVQETFEAAVRGVTCDAVVRANTSGRTDAGVHALAQVVNLYSRTYLDCRTLVKAVNARLPEDVSVLSIDDVPQSFCASKDATSKRYRYVINDGLLRDPFLRRYALHSWKILDVPAMDAGAKFLLGRHDFRSFETEYPNRLSSIRTMFHAAVERVEPGRLHIEVEADGFLYNMVRGIAGTLIKIGRREWPPESVARILAALDRREAGMNVPPEGLFLVQVHYGL
ncbi:MAG: tRNA pseudouridine(38-40) synthase TruA [Fimbriiglobus sp.]